MAFPVLADEPASKAEKYVILINQGTLIVQENGTNRPYGANTLSGVIEKCFRPRYPEVTFVLAPGLKELAIDDLKVGDLTTSDRLADELEAVRVASGYKFQLRDNNGPIRQSSAQPTPGAGSSAAASIPARSVVYLEPTPATANASDSAPNGKKAEAFNLSPLFRDMTPDLEKARQFIEETKLQFGDNHPNVVAAKLHYQILERQLEREDLTMREKVAEIQSIVGETMKTLGLPSDVNFSYHRDMRLLVAVGTPEQLSVTRSILTPLTGMSRSSNSPTDGLSESIKR